MSELTEGERRFLETAMSCLKAPPELDVPKLAEKLNIKPKSVTNKWWELKKKLWENPNPEASSSASAGSPSKRKAADDADDAEPSTPKKTRATRATRGKTAGSAAGKGKKAGATKSKAKVEEEDDADEAEASEDAVYTAVKTASDDEANEEEDA